METIEPDFDGFEKTLERRALELSMMADQCTASYNKMSEYLARLRGIDEYEEIEVHGQNRSISEYDRALNYRRKRSPRSAIGASKRSELGGQSSWTCLYCQRVGTQDAGPDGRQWHVDHIFPKARGGDDGDDNLTLSCATCNLKKHARLASEVLAASKAKLAEVAHG